MGDEIEMKSILEQSFAKRVKLVENGMEKRILDYLKEFRDTLVENNDEDAQTKPFITFMRRKKFAEIYSDRHSFKVFTDFIIDWIATDVRRLKHLESGEIFVFICVHGFIGFKIKDENQVSLYCRMSHSVNGMRTSHFFTLQ